MAIDLSYHPGDSTLAEKAFSEAISTTSPVTSGQVRRVMSLFAFAYPSLSYILACWLTGLNAFYMSLGLTGDETVEYIYTISIGNIVSTDLRNQSDFVWANCDFLLFFLSWSTCQKHGV